MNPNYIKIIIKTVNIRKTQELKGEEISLIIFAFTYKTKESTIKNNNNI
jgi:hypothetical protein